VAEHFSSEDWFDFVRGVGFAERRQEIERHLADGCQDCADLHDTWRAVAEIVHAEPLLDPGVSVVRLARALYSVRERPGRVPSTLERAKLLFDSLVLPAPVGVRNGTSVRRKVLYGTGDLLVDVQIDARPANRTVLVGQVMAPKATADYAAGVPVVVLRGTQVVAKATTNRLGEFQTEFGGPAHGVSLALGLTEHGTVLSLDPRRRVES